MNTPTQEQFQVVIDNLEKANVLAKHEAKVSMMDGSIKPPAWGSPMCHGGWYFIAKGLRKGNFMQGAKAIAKDLGFKTDTELENWAYENPEIWGNKKGDSMFCSSFAFGDGATFTRSLQQIIDHWKSVKERALNN